MLIKTISEKGKPVRKLCIENFYVVLIHGWQRPREGSLRNGNTQMLASNWLDTVRSMVEEMVRRARTQSAAASGAVVATPIGV